MSNLELKKMGRSWWVIGDDEVGPMGPYETKTEAETCRIGMSRFYRHQDKPGYITCESLKNTDDGD